LREVAIALIFSIPTFSFLSQCVRCLKKSLNVSTL
jgi:hypothetical protein